MNGHIFGKNRKRRNTLRKTVRVLEDRLINDQLSKDARRDIVDEIEQISRIRNERIVTGSNVLKVVGTIGILAFAAVMGHKIDRSDEIIQNKNSFGLFNRLSKL